MSETASPRPPTAASPSTVPQLLTSAVQRFGDRTAIVDGEARLSFTELRQAAVRFSAGLLDAGVTAGDRVAIWAPNSAGWIISYLGLVSAGAALVPINTRYKGVEAAEILARARVRALVTVTDFLGTDYVETLRRSSVELPYLDTIVAAHGPAVVGTIPWHEFTSSVSASSIATAERASLDVSDGDVADLMFTSGTTGVPKGVVQTHRSTVQVGSDWVAMTGLGENDRYLMINPFFHMFGLKAGIVACLAAGATMLPEPTFDIERALHRVEQERVSVLPGAPTIYQAILDHPRTGHDLSSLRVAVTGAADIPVTLIRRVMEELPFSTVITGYGLTEAGTATATMIGDDAETIATTVGRPRPGFELRIVGADGQDVMSGDAGALLLRSPTIMSCYLDDVEATSEVLTADGWLSTGDLGTLDDAGNLRIVGRSKDMFIVGGFNAYPAEIENILLRHPDVQQAAVIGIPDERLGEVGMAFVVVSADSSVTPGDIAAWGREQMANYKAPRRVEFVDELPLNATGKVQKDDLRRRAAAAR